MDSNFSKSVGLIAGIFFTIFQGVWGTHHTVSWEVSANQSLHSDWSHESTFIVGDTLIFRMDEDIARVMSKSEYEACSAECSKTLTYRGGEGIELNTSGSWYFMSRIRDRCKSGEKAMIRVAAGESVGREHSLRAGRGGGSGGGGGGGGGGGNGGGGGSGSSSGNAGGFTTPKGNRDHPVDKNAASTLTPPFMDLKLLVLFMLCSILFTHIFWFIQ